MKKRFLPLSLLLVIMMLGQTMAIAGNGGHYVPRTQGSATADSFMSELRANQHTGLIDPALMLKAAAQCATAKGAENDPLYWLSMGPDNFGGQTTAIIYDNTPNAYGNPNGVVYIGSKGGGVYKTYNHGITWHQVGNQNLMVSCMVQDPVSHTIYVGTGDCGAAASFNGLSQQSYDNSFIGSGIYKIENDLMTQIPSTAPANQNGVCEWSFVTDMVIADGKLIAATESGLKYSSDNGNTWTLAKDADGAELSGNAMEVKAMGSEIMAAIDGNVYIGGLDAMVCHSAASVEYDEHNNIVSLPTSDGFLDVAVAPSNDSILYVSCINASGVHTSVYVSVNKGASWEVALPATSAEQGHNLYGGSGLNNHGLVVSPSNPFSVYVLGYNLWELTREEGTTGYFITHQHSDGSAISYVSPAYLHVGLHAMVFNPYNKKECYIGTDGGVFKATKEDGFTFVNCNRNYVTTRMFAVAYSNNVKRVMGAALDHGTIMIEGDENVNHETTGTWVYPINVLGGFSDGYQPGTCAFSMIDPYKIFVSAKNGSFNRSETGGADWVSTNFLTNINSSGTLNTSSFRFPFALVESYSDAENPVEVWAYNETDKPITDSVQAMSVLDYPFYAAISTPLAAGDSVLVHDPISAKMYLAFKDCFYFTRDALEFSSSPTWYLLSKKKDYGFTGDPLSMAVAPDGDKVFVGFKDGKVCRIDNINSVVDAATGCLDSVQCIVTTTFFEAFANNGQCVTSIAVDPQNINNVVVTLGNYGNDNYVYYSNNALSDNPAFVSKQGNLPKMPIYSSVIEMTTGKVILGTEHGIYMTDNISNPNWTMQNANMGDVPVMDLKQQIVKHDDQTVKTLHYEADTSYYVDIVYEGIRNQGMIYAATYGKGLFRCENFRKQQYQSVPESEVVVPAINMYPNPVSDMAKVNFMMNSKGNVSYEVYDICGRRVMSKNLGNYADGSYEVSVDMSALSTGAYIFRLNQGGKSSSVKFVVY